MKEIGQKFRESREKKNISINDASTATKISIKTLQAMEDGDDQNLPAKSYLRGFVQTYAKYLDLDVDEIMKLFLEAHGSTKPKPLTEAETALLEKTNHESAQARLEIYKKAAYATAAIVALLLIYGIHRIVGRYEKEAQTAKDNKIVVESQLATPMLAPGAAPIVAPTTSAETTSPLPNSVPAVAQIPTVSENTQQPAQAITKEAKPEKPTATIEPISSTPLVLSPKTEAPAKEKNETSKVKKTQTQEIILEALDKVEVTYKKDSDGEKTVSLQPEQILTIHANEKISLKISDGGAINITHNGQDNGVPGSLGQSTTLNFP